MAIDKRHILPEFRRTPWGVIRLLVIAGLIAVCPMIAYHVFFERRPPYSVQGLFLIGLGLILIGANLRDLKIGQAGGGIIIVTPDKHPVLFRFYISLNFLFVIIAIGFGLWLFFK